MAIEAWFRRRVDIEERIREAKLGAALRRLPSADPGLNTVWMWAALLAGLLSVTLQSLTRLDTASGRARAARLRFQLLRCPPASSATPAGSPYGSPSGNLLAAKDRHRSWRTTQRYVRVTEDDVAKLTAAHDPNYRRRR